MLTQQGRGAFRTLLDAFMDDRVDPAATAIVYRSLGGDRHVVSRRMLRDTAAGFATGLAGLGVRPGDVVVIAHTEPLEGIFAFWGAMQIGAIPSMFPSLTEKLDPAVYWTNMRTLVQHCAARLVVTSSAFRLALAGAAGCPVVAFEDLRAMPHGPLAAAVSAPSDVALLQHSSGTTGLQKGVALSHEAVLNQIASYSDALALVREDVVVSWLPLYHDMGLIAGFLLPVVQALPLVLMSPFEWVRRPASLLRAIDAEHGTLCWLPNFAFNHCARRVLDREIEGVSLDGVRAFVNCSEPILDSSHESFLKRFGALGVSPRQVSTCYAMAENTFAVTQTRLGVAPRRDLVDRAALQDHRATPSAAGPSTAVIVSCGPPIPGVRVRIEDGVEDRRLGEIQISSDSLLTGYHRRPDLDAASLHGGWFRTGDIGYMVDGELYVVGRKKDLIIAGGRNIHPHDLETVVNAVPGVHPGRVVVFGAPDEEEGTELIAVVAEVESQDEEARRAVASAIRRALSSQAGIAASYVHLVGSRWLLKTSSGKIARGANREKWLAERGAAPPPHR